MTETFKSCFGNFGNVAEIEFDWVCEDCEKPLDFLLRMGAGLDVEYIAECCSSEYIITPMYACYNKKTVRDDES